MIPIVRAGRIGVPILVLAISAAGLVDATTLRRMDLPELVDTAERVVHARVIDQRSYWAQDHKQIFTDTEFEVLAEAKGEGPQHLTITLQGGTVGIIDMVVPGTPLFELGNEAVLFTYPRPDGRTHLVGLSMGVMRVVPGPDGEPIAISEVHAGVSYVDSVAGRLRPVSVTPNRVRLEDLMESVRRIDRTGRSDDGHIAGAPDSPQTRPLREDR